MDAQSVVVESYSCRSSGTSLSGSKLRYSWLVTLGDARHCIEFTDSKTSGMKRLFVDGKLKHRKNVTVSPQFKYKWRQGGHQLSIEPKDIKEMQDPKKIGAFMTAVKDAFNKNVDCSFQLLIDDIPFQVFRRSELQLARPLRNGLSDSSGNKRVELAVGPSSQALAHAQSEHARLSRHDTVHQPDTYGMLDSDNDVSDDDCSFSGALSVAPEASYRVDRSELEPRDDSTCSSESEQAWPCEPVQSGTVQGDVASSKWKSTPRPSLESDVNQNLKKHEWEPWPMPAGATMPSLTASVWKQANADSPSPWFDSLPGSETWQEATKPGQQLQQQSLQQQLATPPQMQQLARQHQSHDKLQEEPKQQHHPWDHRDSSWRPWASTNTPSTSGIASAHNCQGEFGTPTSNLASKSSPWDSWSTTDKFVASERTTTSSPWDSWPATDKICVAERASIWDKESARRKEVPVPDPWRGMTSNNSWPAVVSPWPSV